MKFIDKLTIPFIDYKWIIILLFLYFAFEDFITTQYKLYIVNTLLTKFSNSVFTEFIFFLLIFFTLLLAINKYLKGFYFKINTIVYFIIALCFYTYIRSVFRTDLQSLQTLSFLKYFDLLYFIIGINILLHLFLKFKKKDRISYENIPVYIDAPISNSSEDILNRKEKALQVARFIKSNYSDSSIAIGIVGKWGDGKTSFMSLIEESFIGNNDYIIIKFRSWLNISVKSIFNDFFSTVEKEIKPFSIDIAKEIKKYGKSVLPIYKNSTTEILLNSLDLISDNSVSEDFENLDNLLSKLGKKVIVFLDDLDRLQPNEVFEVLKLIRNTASFKTFNYVAGYEKAYLIEALKVHNIPNPEKYCDKIFLNEFYLLPVSNSEINSFLKESLLLGRIDNAFDLNSVFERYSNYSRFNGGENVFDSIQNLRDAKRFLTEFFISVQKVRSEIDLGDFLIIKLLKFCYNDVYFLIYSEKNKFIGNEDNSAYRFSGGVRRISLKKDDKNCSFDFSDSILKKYLLEKDIYSTKQLDNLKVLFQVLFLERSKEPLAFAFNHNFYKYFNDEIDESEIPFANYQKVINSDWGIIANNIKKWQIDGKLFGLSAHLYHTNIKDFDKKEKFENYLRLLFYLGNLEVREKNLNYFHLDYDYIDKCISNYENRISEKFYNSNTNEYKEFILSLLYKSTFPFIFEMRFCNHLYKKMYDDENEILTKRDLKDYIVFGFRSFVELMDFNDEKNNFFHLFHRSILIENYQKEIGSNTWYERKIIFPEIKELSKNVIMKFPDQFLTEILEDGGRRSNAKEQKQIVGINSFVLNIFSSYDEFIVFVKDNINDEFSLFKNEFLKFAENLSPKDSFIEYDFIYPPIKNKLANLWAKRINY